MLLSEEQFAKSKLTSSTVEASAPTNETLFKESHFMNIPRILTPTTVSPDRLAEVISVQWLKIIDVTATRPWTLKLLMSYPNI